MLDTNITMISPTELLEMIANLPPVDLKAVRFLQQSHSRHAGWFPPIEMRADEIAAATKELHDYADSCNKLVKVLSTLSPVPSTIPVLEYGL